VISFCPTPSCNAKNALGEIYHRDKLLRFEGNNILTPESEEGFREIAKLQNRSVNDFMFEFFSSSNNDKLVER